MKLYFVRHGKTAYNTLDVFQGGSVDSSLLERSKQDAEEVGEKLKKISFAGLYVSPLGRTQTTAKHIQKTHNQLASLPLILTPEFREIEFGEWDGKTIKEKSDELQFEYLKNHPEKYDPSSFNGESYSELVKRGEKKLREIIQFYNNEDSLLVVSHGVMLTCLLQHLTGVANTEYRQKELLDNTSISMMETLDYGQTFQLIVWNNKELQN